MNIIITGRLSTLSSTVHTEHEHNKKNNRTVNKSAEKRRIKLLVVVFFPVRTHKRIFLNLIGKFVLFSCCRCRTPTGKRASKRASKRAKKQTFRSRQHKATDCLRWLEHCDLFRLSLCLSVPM